MKKVNVFFAGLFSLLLVAGANAQTNTGADYFPGKWNLLVSGTPNGDIKMIVNLERIEGKLAGSLGDPASMDGLLEFTSVTITDSTLSAIFVAQGMDVSININKKDDKNITGDIMGMFNIEGSRAN